MGNDKKPSTRFPEGVPMRKALVLTTAIVGLGLATLPAKATLLLSEETFLDLGATGFGNAPRLLTIQQNVFEQGSTFVTSTGGTGFTGLDGSVCTSNGTCQSTLTGTNESLTFSVASLGWFTGAQVGIGLDTNEIGSTAGLTFDTLVLTLYDSSGNVLGSFSGDGPVFITQAQLADQQGNGNSVFNIVLDAAQQAQYDTILAANGGAANVFEGLSASFGCITPAVGCGPSTDGAESFLAFQAVPGPIVGAGLPGLVAACCGMFGLNRWRRKRHVA
jgi:hypothetical protein